MFQSWSQLTHEMSTDPSVPDSYQLGQRTSVMFVELQSKICHQSSKIRLEYHPIACFTAADMVEGVIDARHRELFDDGCNTGAGSKIEQGAQRPR